MNKRYINSSFITKDLIDLWIEDGAKDFGRTSYKSVETVVPIENYIAELPCDVHLLESVETCITDKTIVMRNPTSHFYMEDCRISTGSCCDQCYDNTCSSCSKIPEKFQVIHKVTGATVFEYTKNVKLKEYNPKYKIPKEHTYKIEGNKLHLHKEDGYLHIIYKQTLYDEDGVMEIINNEQVFKFIEDYVRFKIMEEDLFNNKDGESHRAKLNLYQIAQDNMTTSRVNAHSVLKEWSKEKVNKAIHRRRNRHSLYRKIIR